MKIEPCDRGVLGWRSTLRHGMIAFSALYPLWHFLQMLHDEFPYGLPEGRNDRIPYLAIFCYQWNVLGQRRGCDDAVGHIGYGGTM